MQMGIVETMRKPIVTANTPCYDNAISKLLDLSFFLVFAIEVVAANQQIESLESL
jgi:hypothetical protein